MDAFAAARATDGAADAMVSGAGGDADDAETAEDPYDTPVVCTSGANAPQGNGLSMDPGMACIACHAMNGGPGFTFAGTVYPTAHEPDGCSGGAIATMAQIVITAADDTVVMLNPGDTGNFFYDQPLALPYRAKVFYMGREREMAEPQTSGDCNSCHTEAGAMLAPGRIMLP